MPSFARCCVSKARPPPVGALPDGAEESERLLREQLRALGLRELRTRARHAGAEEEQLEECLDRADCAAAVIDLLLAAQRAASTDLQEELSGLRVTALVKRAMGAGVEEQQIDDAMDTHDPKAALIELLLAAGTVAAPTGTGGSVAVERQNLCSLEEGGSRPEPGVEPEDKPHFGAGPPQAKQPTSSTGSIVPHVTKSNPAKHVMLSYQWDHQQQVERAYNILTRKGVKCWMDISGGMGADIYESMAEGDFQTPAPWCVLSVRVRC
jgi:hypothetical protein